MSKRLYGIKISKQLCMVMPILNRNFDNPKLDVPNTRLDTIQRMNTSINRICKNIFSNSHYTGENTVKTLGLL